MVFRAMRFCEKNRSRYWREERGESMVGLWDVVVECLWEGVYWSGVVPASRVGGARFKSEKQDPKKYGDWDSDVGDDERTD